MPKRPDHPDRDSTAREVDRLLRQLPGADPSLTTDPDQPPPQTRPPRPPTGVRPPQPPPRPTGPSPAQRWGVWARVAGGVALGAALTQWPYPTACGWPLYGYLAAVFALLLTAGWTATAAWTIRSAAAHTAGLIIGFWGVVLAAEQILPRVGYAADRQWWSCGAVPPPTPVVPLAPTPTAPADSAGDSAATTSPAADSI